MKGSAPCLSILCDRRVLCSLKTFEHWSQGIVDLALLWWILIWLFRSISCTSLPHTGQGWNWSGVEWDLAMCLILPRKSRNLSSQCWHLYGFSPVCFLLCLENKEIFIYPDFSDINITRILVKILNFLPYRRRAAEVGNFIEHISHCLLWMVECWSRRAWSGNLENFVNFDKWLFIYFLNIMRLSLFLTWSHRGHTPMV